MKIELSTMILKGKIKVKQFQFSYSLLQQATCIFTFLKIAAACLKDFAPAFYFSTFCSAALFIDIFSFSF